MDQTPKENKGGNVLWMYFNENGFESTVFWKVHGLRVKVTQCFDEIIKVYVVFHIFMVSKVLCFKKCMI